MPAIREKTNAMRRLDQRKVAYQVYRYNPAIHSASGVADAVGVPIDQVFKTLVVRAEGRPLLVMVPGDREIDPRRLARALGEKSVALASQREAERLTGLLVGGIGALALLDKPFDVCLEQAALAHERILVNGGRRGVNLGIRVDDLIEVTGARIVAAIADHDRPSTTAT